MSLGEAWWFLDTRIPIDARRVSSVLARHGLPIARPDTGQAVLLHADGARPAAVEEVVDSWSQGASLTTQLWLTPDTDVLLTVDEGGALVTFDFDGLTTEEAQRTVAGVLAVATVTRATVGVVVDTYLPDRGDWWRGYFTGPRTPAQPPPEALLALIDEPGHFELTIGADGWLTA